MGASEVEKRPAPTCDFCKTPRDHRAIMLCNPEMDFTICDVCVLALYPIVRTAYSNGSPYDKPQGRPN